MDKMVKAQDVRVGDRLYDNRQWNWLHRWPMVTNIEQIAAGRVAFNTTGRLFVEKAEHPLLVKRALTT